MQITWLGHSAYRLEFGTSVVLIDPFLSGNASFKGDIEEVTAGATHIVLSHGHTDHVGNTVEIASRTGAKVIANFELCMWLARRGVTTIDPMNTGGQTDQGNFSVALTIAFHSSAEIEENGMFQSLGMPNGIVISPKSASEPVVYHCGDTDLFSDMRLIDEIYRPEVVMVPIGDRFTMGPKTAAMAVKRFLPSAKRVLPCHYATFPPLVQSAQPFLNAMAEDRDRVLVLEVGTPTGLSNL